jgi:hypothetical protein
MCKMVEEEEDPGGAQGSAIPRVDEPRLPIWNLAGANHSAAGQPHQKFPAELETPRFDYFRTRVKITPHEKDKACRNESIRRSRMTCVLRGPMILERPDSATGLSVGRSFCSVL